MQNHRTIPRKGLFAASALFLILALTPFAADAKDSLLFILDCSGSMWGRVNDAPKIVLAKKALLTVIAETPETVDVGLMAYGHRRKGDCGDLELIAEIGAPRGVLPAKVESLNALGKTPISAALIKAGELFSGKENPVTVILISDGLETCQGDPCQVAAELIAKGFKLVVHVVGFDVGSDAADQLECIARAGNGRFFKADDIGQLNDALSAVKAAIVEKTPLPEPPQVPPVATETASSKTLRIAGPGTVRLTPAAWVNMPPRSWALADAETGEIRASGTGNELRVKAGEYQVLWRQSEHGHVDTLLTAVVRVESGKTVSVPIDTGIRLAVPDGLESPRAWGLILPGEASPFWKTSEVGKAQVAPAGSYQLYWHQDEHASRPVILGQILLESGRLNDIAADSGLVLQPAAWAPTRYYYYELKNPAGEMVGSWQKAAPQLAPPGEYTLILRPKEHHHNDIVWGAVTVPEHDFVKIPINSGLQCLHGPDAKPPYGIFLTNLDSGHEIAARETWDPIPAPPGRYRLDFWERQHESARQTLVDEFILEPGVLLEVEM